MYSLGLNYGHHDASVSLVKNGKIIYSVAEERFNRIKHYSNIPLLSLENCLKERNIFLKDVDVITLPTPGYYDKKLNLITGRNMKGLLSFATYSAEMTISDYFRFLALYIVKQLHGLVEEQLPLYQKRFIYPSDKPIFTLDHHLAHAASAYYTSGFEERSLVITADGSGDALSLTVWIGEQGNLSPRMKVGNNGSLGLFYSLVTEALGWWIGDGEGKTMGLAPYGNTKKTGGVLDKWRPHYEEGILKKGVNFGAVGAWSNPAGTIHWHMREVREVKKLVDRYGAENIAAEAQKVLEEEMVPLIISWLNKEKTRNLAVSGGVFLNVKLNQRLCESRAMNRFHVYPDAGDGGLSAGAALYSYYRLRKGKYNSIIKSVYWGKGYSDDYIENLLKTRRLKYRKQSESDLYKIVARKLTENKIIGWFNGKMETGPRALGNRSILMDPRRAINKDIINQTVKYREAFRPFCPSMTLAAAKKYLVNYINNAYFMVISFNVTKEAKKDIPAVVHVDGTARPQIVTEETNKPFYYLIKEFGNLTGVEALLNTSFNVKGEPIVSSPSDALKCFIDTGMDYLVLGNFIISK